MNSYHLPQTYVETNVLGTLNIVLAARNLGVERVIPTSTSEVYGNARFVPITEAHPLEASRPIRPARSARTRSRSAFMPPSARP